MNSRTTPRLRYGATAHSKCNSRSAQLAHSNSSPIAPSNVSEQRCQNGRFMARVFSAQSSQTRTPRSVSPPPLEQRGEIDRKLPPAVGIEQASELRRAAKSE